MDSLAVFLITFASQKYGKEGSKTHGTAHYYRTSNKSQETGSGINELIRKKSTLCPTLGSKGGASSEFFTTVGSR